MQSKLYTNFVLPIEDIRGHWLRSSMSTFSKSTEGVTFRGSSKTAGFCSLPRYYNTRSCVIPERKLKEVTLPFFVNAFLRSYTSVTYIHFMPPGTTWSHPLSMIKQFMIKQLVSSCPCYIHNL